MKESSGRRIQRWHPEVAALVSLLSLDLPCRCCTPLLLLQFLLLAACCGADNSSAMDQLELLLSQFLVPENQARKRAEEQIRRLSKDPQLVPALLHHVRSSASPEVRQLAAVLLRKKITGHWMQLPIEVRNSVKWTLLESITVEHRYREMVFFIFLVSTRFCVCAIFLICGALRCYPGLSNVLRWIG